MSKQLLSLTSKCIQQILARSKKNEMLRVTIDSGGCNGFSYNYKFDDNIKKDDTLIEEEGAKVVVDNISSYYLEGAVIDYRDEMIRSGFIIEKNPNADTACSCSSSFSVRN